MRIPEKDRSDELEEKLIGFKWKHTHAKEKRPYVQSSLSKSASGAWGKFKFYGDPRIGGYKPDFGPCPRSKLARRHRHHYSFSDGNDSDESYRPRSRRSGKRVRYPSPRYNNVARRSWIFENWQCAAGETTIKQRARKVTKSGNLVVITNKDVLIVDNGCDQSIISKSVFTIGLHNDLFYYVSEALGSMHTSNLG